MLVSAVSCSGANFLTFADIFEDVSRRKRKKKEDGQDFVDLMK